MGLSNCKSAAGIMLSDEQDVHRIGCHVGDMVDWYESSPRDATWTRPRHSAKIPRKRRWNSKVRVKDVKKNVPTKSKRPLSAYNLFFRDQRDLVSAVRRQMPPSENCPSIAKIISQQWKALMPQVRARYDAIAAEAKLHEYNKKQGWMIYSQDEPSLGDGEGEVRDLMITENIDMTAAQQGNISIEADEQDGSEIPWPWESIQGLARELDPACIDFLIRNFA